MAPAALAQVGELTDTVDETTGGTTTTTSDTVTGTVGDTTETVDGTVGDTTDTVNGTVSNTTDTVDGTIGDTTDTVNGTVSNTTDTVDGTVSGGSGSDKETSSGSSPSGSESTTSPSGSGSSTSDPVGSGPGGDDNEPVPAGATVIKLPDGSTVVIPGNAGGDIEGRKVFGAGALPKEVLVALNGLIDGFASAGAATPLTTADRPAPEGASFLDNASRLAAEAAKKLAFPTTLALIVVAFLMIHGRVGRRDPKLAEARVDAHEDALTFR